ncbi:MULTISPECIES: SDR family NAD(P)-dependent oxidoreductase [Acetobacter]|uniref:3-oxoacyl-(Acyl-carrier-protein) reductase FabG n=4 Tax=Acetobacter TaxID=434 RepID=A0A1Y0V5Z7_9PROT|nr:MULTISPECIES: SDR family NAD(P)-dependent oxidoreductase [Acetobacter]ARW11823.1 3-oxoacyl-(acyl-carrier-protein) reductase FabG [Acetobacter ascendens]ARW49194.1 3-oxoacyl-(acyl-carrier-protein) reductase FabG [Acetobacter pasteurianus subsp. pasteurianus]OAZ73795.1 3-oxoacyl-(acyl-carrier-protein) reductase FabG [Acetobacter pasteurianus]GCD60140.1 oxidoreductase [Acetobacter pasteurianus NBRC 3277]GCD63642.1 oxidoreductase [Acetobacter pasteurianus NBRC 3278]
MSKIWFVTGSSRGLGRDIVEAALAAGDSVVATARKPADLDAVVAQYGDRVFPLALDVTDARAAQAAALRAKEHFGRIDVVVNNAGYANIASVEDITIEDFTQQVQTNFFGVAYVSKAVLPILREQGHGHIFQIASIGARIATPGLSAYQAAKFAVRGFSLALAQEMAPLGVKVTTIEPGGIRTDWAGSSMKIPPISAPYEQTVGTFAKMIRESSGHQSSDPAKIASLIVDLANRADAPTELLVGVDAVEYAKQAAEAVTENDRKWRSLSITTAAD